MPKLSPEVDRYIRIAEPFAQPILERIRAAFHEGCPDVEESIKWNFPHFEHHGVLGNMSAFTKHVRWGFWKAKLMSDPAGMLEGDGESMMGAKISDISELPTDKIMISYVREAARLNEEGIKPLRTKRAPADVEVPDDLAAALKKNAAARKAFDASPPGQQREYIDWLAEAKQEATRKKRLATAIEWIAEGKRRNWKYEAKKK